MDIIEKQVSFDEHVTVHTIQEFQDYCDYCDEFTQSITLFFDFFGFPLTF